MQEMGQRPLTEYTRAMQGFWLLFWIAYAIFMAAVGFYALLRLLTVLWLMRYQSASERDELRASRNYWLWNALFFSANGFSAYTLALHTGGVFAGILFTVGIALFLVVSGCRAFLRRKGKVI